MDTGGGLMKKIIITLSILLFILAISACGDNNNVQVTEDENLENVQEMDTTVVEVTEPTAEPQDNQTPKESESKADLEEEQAETDRQKLLEYLQILGLDENTQYTLLDKFPIEDSEEVSILTDIIDIDDEAFNEIIDTMKSNGCYLVSDIMIDEEKQTTSMQFRNADDSLYIELVYSADSDYITIIFSPIN